ncbi:MAG: 16S rRNA (guanine(966)-N(2))-methyltransferase RsmD [Chitinivibrionales bacterium]|nr:16S rRNA (guanine(966)-N(2))-methyltransferase RsmD [Chitinivibrionales bacterium]
MKLRIIAGNLKGRFITVRATAQRFRPTLERHRESVLQVLTPYLQGACAADLCAGSGVVGFEMLSRGAASVDFVESDRARARGIREHAEAFGVTDRCRVHCMPLARFVRDCRQRYDVVYYDPPYGDDRLAQMAGGIFVLLCAGGILAYEHARERPSPALDTEAALARHDTRTYGIATIDFYEKAG